MWDIILNPFLTVLLFLHQFLGNTVLTIAVFTILVRLLTFPFYRAQIKSSQKMQEIQPKLKKIQEKYKNDREKLAQAQMEIYREAGINPLLGGCLPLLITLPIMLGLYQAIITALGSTPMQLLNLHGRLLIPDLVSLVPLENQFLWLNLAQPDPYFILPVLVVATQWLQQRLMMPSSASSEGEEGQAQAMSRSLQYTMPLMFGFFSLSLASGLSIYFIVSSLVGIGQSFMMGRSDLSRLLGRGKKPKSESNKKKLEPDESGS
jgi:YidC/Oxa1 family membrane protein insertase